MPAVSPLARALPELPPISGVRLGAVSAALRYRDRPDLMMAELAPGTTVAGVFTRNRCPGVPVDWCRAALPGGRAQALVVNAGQANVFTGAAGQRVAEATAAEAARLVGCAHNHVFLASTGVIGQVPPADKIVAALPSLHARLSPQGYADAARGMMTTDTFPKAATAAAMLGGVRVRIAGIAKGSGMIAPDMATMLAFVFTDAALPAPLLQRLLRAGVERSFHCTTVDADTSTSDTVLLFATGAAGNAADADTAGFARALDAVLLELALLVVRDGEGAQKLIRIDVAGAVDAASARRVGLAIANSPLVKTAVAGADANWGRIAMAVGRAGEPAERDRLSIAIGGTWMAREGAATVCDEAPVAAHMGGREIVIGVDLGLGAGCATVWTCDLTHGYIDINGSYRS